ncbi:unnamed protein product [Cochlearia groenlandica]
MVSLAMKDCLFLVVGEGMGIIDEVFMGFGSNLLIDEVFMGFGSNLLIDEYCWGQYKEMKFGSQVLINDVSSYRFSPSSICVIVCLGV